MSENTQTTFLTPLAFLFRVLPVLGLALVVCLAGYSFGGVLTSETCFLLMLIAFFLLVSLFVFQNHAPLNFVVLCAKAGINTVLLPGEFNLSRLDFSQLPGQACLPEPFPCGNQLKNAQVFPAIPTHDLRSQDARNVYIKLGIISADPK